MFPWSIIMYTIRYLTLTHVYFNNPLWTSKKNQSCLRLGAMIFHFKNIPLDAMLTSDEINFGRLQIVSIERNTKDHFSDIRYQKITWENQKNRIWVIWY